MGKTIFLLLALTLATWGGTPVTSTVVNTWYSYVDGTLVSTLRTTVGSFARNAKGDEVTVTPTSTRLKKRGKTYSLLPASQQYIALPPGVSSSILQSTVVLQRVFAVNSGTRETVNGVDCVAIAVHGSSHGLNGVGKMWISPEYSLQIKIDMEWNSHGQRVGRSVMEMIDIQIGTEPDSSLFSIPAGNKHSRK